MKQQEKIKLTYDELYSLIKEGYRNGYAIYEMADAGLEPYDAEGYTRWVLAKYEPSIKTKKTIKYNTTKNFITKWYPVILAFICMLYSIGLGLSGNTEGAAYSAHWPGTILLFAIAIRQRRNTNTKNKI